MVDISGKIKTHRSAVAQAIVKVSRQDTIDAVNNKTVPKGDVLEAARVAGLFGVKRTSDMIPDCHPLPVESAQVRFSIEGLEIKIEMEVHTVYKTGVEVEAMHGASIAALTIYDMLKPIDKEIEITGIRLISKKGGKSQFNVKLKHKMKAAVVVCSDSISAGKNQDASGTAVIERLKKYDISVEDYSVVPDDLKAIREKVLGLCEAKADLIILTGGTGLSKQDVTPEAIRSLLDREIPGIGEAARNYGQEQMPYAMLSRSFAGIKGTTLILALPGSVRGAVESMDALFPYVLHVFNVMDNEAHDIG